METPGARSVRPLSDNFTSSVRPFHFVCQPIQPICHTEAHGAKSFESRPWRLRTQGQYWLVVQMHLFVTKTILSDRSSRCMTQPNPGCCCALAYVTLMCALSVEQVLKLSVQNHRFCDDNVTQRVTSQEVATLKRLHSQAAGCSGSYVKLLDSFQHHGHVVLVSRQLSRGRQWHISLHDVRMTYGLVA